MSFWSNPGASISHVVQQVSNVATKAVASPIVNPVGAVVDKVGMNPTQLLNPVQAAKNLVNNPLVNPVGVGVAKVTGISPVNQLETGAAVGATVAAAPLVKAGATAVKTAVIARTLVSKPAQPATLAPAAAPAPVAPSDPAKAGLWLAGITALLQIM